MKVTYAPLLRPMTLPNGAKLSNRIVMAPMVMNGSHEDGTISKEDIAFFEKRSDVAGLLITGSAYVNASACGFSGQISIAKDEDIPGLRKLVTAAKKDGNKIIVQLHHAGREAIPALVDQVVAPSSRSFPFLDHIPKEMSEKEIEETICDFGRATERAIKAGFDGVEIHGANHYLLQQFFSRYSNQRTDAWGGTLEKRMAFPLAVIQEVKRVVASREQKDFIVGYRISPEEIHGEHVGYTIDESLSLIEEISTKNLDYIHLSLFKGFSAKPEGYEKSYGELMKEVVNNRCPVIIVSNIFTADEALKALTHGDLVAIGRAALVEPEFTKKIHEGKENEINTSVKNRLDMLAIPQKAIDGLRNPISTLPPLPGLPRE